jgi:tetratricopeptide (TPR) repeat protein
MTAGCDRGVPVSTPNRAGRFGAAMTLAAVVVLGVVIVGHADQTDGRLDSLFAELMVAPSGEVAAPIERQIWAIWGEIDDPSAAALLASGTIALSERELGTAIRHFTALIELAPGFAEGWNKRATAHYLAGDYQRSLEDIARTLELEPRHFGALSGRGQVYVELGDARSALAAFDAALEVDPFLAGANTSAAALRKILGEREI